VLIAGGSNSVIYAHAEIFDPESEKFTDTEDEMATPRNDAMAAPLPDGRVLIAGGYSDGEALGSAETFDPTSETFSPVAATTVHERYGAVAAALPNGLVLLVGGYSGNEPDRSAEIFNPTTGDFKILIPEIDREIVSAAGLALLNGEVLIAGGTLDGFAVREAALLDPVGPSFASLPSEGGTQLTTERNNAIAAPLPDGKVLITGGSWPNARSTAEVFVPASAFRASGGAFGTRLLGENSSPANVVITSLGGWDLEIDAVSLSGPDAADFAIVADSCSGAKLDFEQSCTMSVRFNPTRLGDARAALVFDDNEPVPADVALTAATISPTVPGRPVQEPPLGPASPSRTATSVECASKRIPRSKRVRVTCRANLGPGTWDAQLRRRGQTVARRLVSGGAQQLTFRPLRGQGGSFRLQLIPLAY